MATFSGTLTFAGFGDWRVPNIRELRSLFDSSRASPAIDTVAFPNMPASFFWSSTEQAFVQSNAWNVFFDDGRPFASDKGNAYHIRMVRAGKSLQVLDVDRPTSDYVVVAEIKAVLEQG